MKTAEAARPRVAFLDGLRGIAALFVVFCHAAGALFPAVLFGTSKGGFTHLLYATPFVNIPFQGHFMVCVFYALSGLALSYNSLSRGRRGPAVSGLVRRYPRLMLPVLAGVLLAAGLLALSLFPVKEASLISHSGWWGKYLHFHPTWSSAFHEGRVGVFQRAHSSYDPPLWTMHTELLGSLLVFAVLILSPRRWVRLVAYPILAWYYLGGYLLAFVGGMVICEAWVALGDRPRRWAPYLVPVGLYGLLLGSYPIPSANTPDFYRRIVPGVFGHTPLQWQSGAHVLGAILVLATVVAFVPLRRPLETAPARFLGRVSFALYIVHFLVLGSLGARLLIALHGLVPYRVSALTAYGAVLAGSILAAWVFTILVDEPAVALTGWAYRQLIVPFQWVGAKFVPPPREKAPKTIVLEAGEPVTSPPARSTSDPGTSSADLSRRD